MRYKNYIFDLYGTLIDTRTDESSVLTWTKFNSYLSGLGLAHGTPKRMCNMYFKRDLSARQKAHLTGNGIEFPEIDIVPVFADILGHYGNLVEGSYVSPAGDLSRRYPLADICYGFRCASRFWLRLYPNVNKLLVELHNAGANIYLLSNAQATYTRPELVEMQLPDKFDGMLISSEELCMKPDSAFYKKLFDRYKLNPAESVMIGDSFDSDITGARSVGMDSIWLHNRACSEADTARKTTEAAAIIDCYGTDRMDIFRLTEV